MPPSSAIKNMRLLHPRMQNVLKPVFQRGAYCLHPEYLLQSMLASDNQDLRKCAVRIIISIRMSSADPTIGDRSFHSRPVGPQAQRERNNPPIDWQATSLKDIIFWDQAELLEPPLTCSITTEDLKRFELDGVRVQVPSFPLHTQALERMSSLSTEVSIHFILSFTLKRNSNTPLH